MLRCTLTKYSLLVVTKFTVTNSILHYVLEYLRHTAQEKRLIRETGSWLLHYDKKTNSFRYIRRSLTKQNILPAPICHLGLITFTRFLQTAKYFSVKRFQPVSLTSIICTMRYSVSTCTELALPSRPNTKLFTTYVPLKPHLNSATSNIASGVLNLDNSGQTMAQNKRIKRCQEQWNHWTHQLFQTIIIITDLLDCGIVWLIICKN